MLSAAQDTLTINPLQDSKVAAQNSCNLLGQRIEIAVFRVESFDDRVSILATGKEGTR